VIRVVLFEPEIPGNTGNIIRLCANTGTELHLIEPLGFDLDDTKLRRAGLDYHEWANIKRHTDFSTFVRAHPEPIVAFSTHATHSFFDRPVVGNQTLLFGPETRGLPAEIRDTLPEADVVRLPMRTWSRSLNLSNAVAVAVYETWRQQGFAAP
jgi:tRNA (cytidine/uridine-2'-O-)-methyltransferase